MSKKVLIVKSSPAADASVSNEVANQLAAQMREASEDYHFTIRDLAQHPAPVYDSEILGSFYGDQENLTQRQIEIAKPSLEYIAEIQAADIIVLASPMHNFGITSLLKNYIDQICRFGLTFQYTEQGLKGLITDKKAIIIASAGNDFSSPAAQATDFQIPYLKQVLGFIGIDDVEVVTAYGVALGEDGARNAQQQAKRQIQRLVATGI